jgi:hypothetical protein
MQGVVEELSATTINHFHNVLHEALDTIVK